MHHSSELDDASALKNMLVLSEDMKFIFQLSEGRGRMYFDGI